MASAKHIVRRAKAARTTKAGPGLLTRVGRGLDRVGNSLRAAPKKFGNWAKKNPVKYGLLTAASMAGGYHLGKRLAGRVAWPKYKGGNFTPGLANHIMSKGRTSVPSAARGQQLEMFK